MEGVVEGTVSPNSWPCHPGSSSEEHLNSLPICSCLVALLMADNCFAMREGEQLWLRAGWGLALQII